VRRGRHQQFVLQTGLHRRVVLQQGGGSPACVSLNGARVRHSFGVHLLTELEKDARQGRRPSPLLLKIFQLAYGRTRSIARARAIPHGATGGIKIEAPHQGQLVKTLLALYRPARSRRGRGADARLGAATDALPRKHDTRQLGLHLNVRQGQALFLGALGRDMQLQGGRQLTVPLLK